MESSSRSCNKLAKGLKGVAVATLLFSGNHHSVAFGGSAGRGHVLPGGGRLPLGPGHNITASAPMSMQQGPLDLAANMTAILAANVPSDTSKSDERRVMPVGGRCRASGPTRKRDKGHVQGRVLPGGGKGRRRLARGSFAGLDANMDKGNMTTSSSSSSLPAVPTPDISKDKVARADHVAEGVTDTGIVGRMLPGGGKGRRRKLLHKQGLIAAVAHIIDDIKGRLLPGGGRGGRRLQHVQGRMPVRASFVPTARTDDPTQRRLLGASGAAATKGKNPGPGGGRGGWVVQYLMDFGRLLHKKPAPKASVAVPTTPRPYRTPKHKGKPVKMATYISARRGNTTDAATAARAAQPSDPVVPSAKPVPLP